MLDTACGLIECKMIAKGTKRMPAGAMNEALAFLEQVDDALLWPQNRNTVDYYYCKTYRKTMAVPAEEVQTRLNESQLSSLTDTSASEESSSAPHGCPKGTTIDAKKDDKCQLEECLSEITHLYNSEKKGDHSADGALHSIIQRCCKKHRLSATINISKCTIRYRQQKQLLQVVTTLILHSKTWTSSL